MSSIKCKYITTDKLSDELINFKTYQCDDMSITKMDDKKYSENNKIDKDHNCFGYIQVYYHKNPLLYITTPPMKNIFGIQKKGKNNFQMNLQFTNLEEDPKMKQFFEFIQNIEFACMKYLGLTTEDCDRFISQIQYDKNEIYEPNLLIKIPFHYNRFLTDLYSDYSSYVNIFNIPKYQTLECDLYIDKVWRMNDKFYMKWKCKIIHIL
mgnify:CR=1 FL=1